MATPPLDAQTLQNTIDAVEQHGGVSQAARALGINYSTFQSRYRSAKSGGVSRVRQPEPDIVEPLASFDEAWTKWQTTIGMAKDRYRGPAKKREQKAKRKILVIPDLHVPYHEPEMVAEMLIREGDADHAVCIGDFGDAYALSRFLKYEDCSWKDEWAAVTLLMQTLSETFPTVEVIIGNHDVRLEKQLRLHLTKDMVDAVTWLANGTLCPVTALCRRFTNITVAKHETPGGHTVDWFTTVGDAWLGHPEKYSRVPGSALRSCEEWLADNEQAMGLQRYRLIVMGHTHQMAMVPWRGGQLLVECGCLCLQQGYMTSPRIGGRPQRRGYTTFHQIDGKTDLNSVRNFWFDVQ